MRNRSVLLISPFEDERTMYSEYLQVKGFEVIVQAEPSKALTTASHEPIQAIVAHVRQRGPVDGIALTRAVRSALGDRIAVLLLSTAIDPGVRNEALAADCDRFLLLPCPPEELEQEVRAAVGGRTPE